MFYTCLKMESHTSDQFNTNCSHNATSDGISALKASQRIELGVVSEASRWERDR